MGQQQLLLLVLGIVIVGLAVVVGIQAFSENQKKANADAMVNDAIRIASDAQAWKLKPAAFGGGASEVEWTSLSFAQMGYETSAGSGMTATYTNLNADYVMSDQVAGPLKITATSTASSGGNIVIVTVAGTRPTDITTKVN